MEVVDGFAWPERCAGGMDGVAAGVGVVEDWTYVARAKAKIWGWRKGHFGTTCVSIRSKATG